MDMNSIHTNRCRTAGDWGEKSVKSRPFQRSERSTGTAFSTSLPTASSTTPWLELVSVEVGWDHLLSLLYTCVQSLDFLALFGQRELHCLPLQLQMEHQELQYLKQITRLHMNIQAPPVSPTLYPILRKIQVADAVFIVKSHVFQHLDLCINVGGFPTGWHSTPSISLTKGIVGHRGCGGNTSTNERCLQLWLKTSASLQSQKKHKNAQHSQNDTLELV